MPQFLIPPGKKPNDLVSLPKEESRHLSKVLRAREGDLVRLTDGAGRRFEGRIESISPQGTQVRIGSVLPASVPKGRVLLAQGLLKGEKMETVIQKAAELGAAALLPFTSSRTVAAWKNEPRKLERWRKIGEAASKQSGRSNHLEVREPAAWEGVLKTPADAKILFWEEAERSADDFFESPTPGSVLILVGPEGGLSKEEVAAAQAKGFKVLSLGSLILRSETAALAALTIIQHELGNI